MGLTREGNRTDDVVVLECVKAFAGMCVPDFAER